MVKAVRQVDSKGICNSWSVANIYPFSPNPLAHIPCLLSCFKFNLLLLLLLLQKTKFCILEDLKRKADLLVYHSSPISAESGKSLLLTNLLLCF